MKKSAPFKNFIQNIQVKGVPSWFNSKEDFLYYIFKNSESEEELLKAFGYLNTCELNKYLRNYLPELPQEFKTYCDYINSLLEPITKQSGIYILLFENTNGLYIGKSGDILSRYKQHVSMLIHGTASANMLEEYEFNETLPILYKQYFCHPHWAELLETSALNTPIEYWGIPQARFINTMFPKALLKDMPYFNKIANNINAYQNSPFTYL